MRNGRSNLNKLEDLAEMANRCGQEREARAIRIIIEEFQTLYNLQHLVTIANDNEPKNKK